MAAKLTGLGRGLDALIRETSSTPSGAQSSAPRVLPINSVEPNPDQPRKHFSEKALDELARSIKSQGLLQPILVRSCGEAKPGKYEIVAGERRWRACKLAGLEEITVIVRSFSAQETLLVALVENLQREDLNSIEEALGIELLRENFSLNQEELAREIGKSRSAIANSLRLLSLPVEIQENLAAGDLSAGHGRAILGVENKVAQLELRDILLKRKSSVREAEAMLALWKKNGSFELTSDLENALEEKGVLRPAKKSAQSKKMKGIQSKLAEKLEAVVQISGSDDKGKITISYNSGQELAKVLNSLGISE